MKISRIYLKFFSLLFVFSLVFGVISNSFVSYAKVSDLMIGTGSNALMTMELDDSDYAVMPMSSLGSVINTVRPAGLSVQVRYYDNGGVLRSKAADLLYENNIYRISCSLPTGSSLYLISVMVGGSSLPSAGTYEFSFDYASDISMSYDNFRIYSYKDIANASAESSSLYPNFEQYSGDLYVSPYRFNLTNVNNLELIMYLNNSLEQKVNTVAGSISVGFRRVASDASAPSTGIDNSVSDYQDDVSSSLSDLSFSVDTMTDEISGVTEAIQNLQGAMEPHYSNVLTQLHHITEQLHAFYDQVYNNIHLVELDILEGILAAIENMDLEVNVELGGLKQTIERVSSEIQANDNKLAAEQIANDEANTEEIKDAVEEHGNFIIDGLKGLFIPSDEFFKSYFDDLYGYFSDRFGFLSFPFDLLARFVDLVVNSSDVDCVLTLPSFEIMGEQLLYENSFNLTEFLEQNFGFLLSAIRMGTSIILIMSFVQLCGDKWKEVMNR